jgi:hypothetical protein
VTPGQCDSLGVPSVLKIRKISSISESPASQSLLLSEIPGKRGVRLDISAKMQPTDHISTAVEYWREPRRTSGGRYHKVTIYVRYRVQLYATSCV